MPRLGSKQSSSSADFDRAWRLTRADHARANRLVGVAAQRVSSQVEGVPAYGWSAGKDSLALAVVCEAAGVDLGVMATCALEYPAMTRWVSHHKPPGVVVQCREEFDLDWLAANQHRLFPSGGRDGYFWTSEVTHWGQRAFAREHGVGTMIYGRRSIDGNVTGTGGVSRGSKGLTINPIYDWSHEDVFVVLKSRGISLPPCYGWPDGWTTGTTPWPGRRFPTVQDGWRVTNFIDPNVVAEAARVIPSAAAYLGGSNG